ncbi:MAG: MAPEG family protein [Gammaproteobacteria bacterium]|nr:MAPEG family protein [Pseudomonadales bacterium]MCP5348219.1 MAPEG family protein [Pseudomonadales bacterium]
MNQDLIFIPLLIQIILTLFVFYRIGAVKEEAVKNGEVDQSRRALHDDAWPESVQKVNNNIRNQFETPVLFYVLVILLWLLGAAGPLAQAIALAYALLRIAHARVHLGSNIVRLRKRLFQASMVMLFILTGLVLLALVDPGLSGNL